MPALWVVGGSAALGAGASIFGGLMAAKGASKQAKAIKYSADKASQTALELNTRSRADLQPFRDLGVQSGEMISDIYSGARGLDDVFKASSLYNFQSELGTRGINRQLSARGQYGSGAGLESLALFEKGLVAEEGNRYFDKLFSTTALGSNAAAQQASNTTSTGNTLAQVGTQAGIAQGAAYANQYNAYGSIGPSVAGSVRGGIGDYMTMQYLDRFFPSNANAGQGALLTPNYAAPGGRLELGVPQTFRTGTFSSG